jgi:hypothetical protein
MSGNRGHPVNQARFGKKRGAAPLLAPGQVEGSLPFWDRSSPNNTLPGDLGAISGVQSVQQRVAHLSDDKYDDSSYPVEETTPGGLGEPARARVPIPLPNSAVESPDNGTLTAADVPQPVNKAERSSTWAKLWELRSGNDLYTLPELRDPVICSLIMLLLVLACFVLDLVAFGSTSMGIKMIGGLFFLVHVALASNFLIQQCKTEGNYSSRLWALLFLINFQMLFFYGSEGSDNAPFDLAVRIIAAASPLMLIKYSGGSADKFNIFGDMTDIVDLFLVLFTEEFALKSVSANLLGFLPLGGFIMLSVTINIFIALLRLPAPPGFSNWKQQFFNDCMCCVGVPKPMTSTLVSFFFLELPFMCIRLSLWLGHGIPVGPLILKNMFMVITQGADIRNAMRHDGDTKQQDLYAAQAKDWLILAVMKMAGVNPDLAKDAQLTKLQDCIASLQLDKNSCANLQLEPLSPRAQPPNPQAAWFAAEQNRERMQWEMERVTYLKDLDEWKRYGQKLEEELDETRANSSRQGQAFGLEREAWQRERQTMQRERQDMSGVVQEKEDEIVGLHNEIKRLRSGNLRIQELEVENVRLRNRDGESAHLHAKIKELQHEIDTLQRRIRDLEEENDKLRFTPGDGDDSVGTIGPPMAGVKAGNSYHVFTHHFSASEDVSNSYHVSFEEHPDQDPRFKIDLACRGRNGAPKSTRIMDVSVTYESEEY